MIQRDSERRLTLINRHPLLAARLRKYGDHFMRTVKASLAILLLAFVTEIAWAQQKTPDPKQKEESLTQLVEKHFAHWDRDHNNVLDLVEVDHQIEDHSVRGRQAALIVSLRHHLTDKNKNEPKLSHEKLLKLAEEKDFIKSVDRLSKHLETIDRELFLPTDPDLSTFSQGGLSDCYLLAAIAAQVHRSPRSIREMIHTDVTGGFRVEYGDGQKIQVAPLTDSELLLGARLDNRHGSWLAVLEKSYGIIRKHERTKKVDKAAREAATIPIETLNYGDSKPIISLLTGRHADALILNKSHLDQVHNVLVDVTKNRRLICVGKNKDPGPPGIVSSHLYAILDYDAQKRHVTIFNPWGNNFSPKGPDGITNGYATKNGVFKVPLDEFHRIFADIAFETNRPLSK